MYTSLKHLGQTLALASVIALTGCGGGGKGGASSLVRPDPTNPYAGWNENPTALDIGEHWREVEAVGEALNTDPSTPGDTTGLAVALAAAQTADNTSSTVLRNMSPSRMTPIGTNGEITVGHWSDGPAHTLDIDFDWTGFPNATPDQRALVERAAREWARRISTQVISDPIEAGARIVAESRTLGPETARELTVGYDIDPDGMLVFMFDGGDAMNSFAGSAYRRRNGVSTHQYGRFVFSRRHLDSRRVAVHEIGHVIGITGFDQEHRRFPEGYVDLVNHTFNGPAAVNENGGSPVPFQWLDANREVQPPGTAGATPDYNHLGVCDSVMAYCSDRRVIQEPQPIDFAVLNDLGYDLLSVDEAAEPEVYGFGAWARYSAWGAGVERQIDHETGDDFTRANADAFGVEPTIAFADAVVGLTGNAIWNGNLIAVDQSTPDLPPVLGSATLEISLDTLEGEARFNRLTSVQNSVPTAFRHSSLHYAIALDGNGFSDADEHVAGSLYGPEHQETAGVLDDDRDGVEILGAFGGVRID